MVKGGTAQRIIPARAGFTHSSGDYQALRRDHPRSRGVYYICAVEVGDTDGSSPLARGLPHRRAQTSTGRGIIPARAGFTWTASMMRCKSPDHPRSRGVYRVTPAASATDAGSSPLARGLPVLAAQCIPRPRIIPARAGFTLADPWNPNDESPYQTTFAFTADLALAPQSSDSVVVSQRSTRTPSEA